MSADDQERIDVTVTFLEMDVPPASVLCDLGPIELSVKEKKTVNVPVWAGVGAIVAGGLLLVFSKKKSVL